MKSIVKKASVGLIVSLLVVGGIFTSSNTVAAQTATTLTPAQTQALIAQLQAQLAALTAQLNALIAAQQNNLDTRCIGGDSSTRCGVATSTISIVSSTNSIPTTSRISPKSGVAGDRIVITGTGFSLNGNKVLIMPENGDGRKYILESVASSNGREIAVRIQKEAIPECPTYGYAECIRTNSALQLVPGKYTIFVRNNDNGLMGGTVTLEIRSGTQNTSVSGTPTLSLQYDSASKEVSLVSTATVTITAGSEAVYLPVNSPVYTNLFLVGASQSISANNRPTTITADASKDGNYYVVPAGRSATFQVKTTFYPNELFAGNYRTQISTELYAAPGANRSVAYNTETSNTITIVGERAPYISTVNGKNWNTKVSVKQGEQLQFNGARLTDRILINSSVYTGEGITTYRDNGNTVRFVIPNTFTAGTYKIEFQNNEGKSNPVWINVSTNTSVETLTLRVQNQLSTGYQTPTIDLGSVETVTIAWNAPNAEYCNTYGQTLLKLSDGSRWNVRDLPNTGTRTFAVSAQRDANGNQMTSASIGVQCWKDNVSDSKGMIVYWTVPTIVERQTVSVVGNSFEAGSDIRVNWETNVTRTNDWVGVFKKGASNQQYVTYKYIPNGEASAGDISLTAPSVAGDYEVRYFKNSGYTAVATSRSFTVTQPQVNTNYTVSIDNSAVAYVINSAIQVSWTAPSNATTSQDWVGIFAKGANNETYVSWKYITGASGTVNLQVPNIPGEYEIRYLKNNGYTSVATSKTFIVLSLQPNATTTVSLINPKLFVASVVGGWNFLFDELVARGW